MNDDKLGKQAKHKVRMQPGRLSCWVGPDPLKFSDSSLQFIKQGGDSKEDIALRLNDSKSPPNKIQSKNGAVVSVEYKHIKNNPGKR